MATRTTDDIFWKCHEALSAAGAGLKAFVGRNPPDRRKGLYDLAVYGRSVTLILQTLRAIDRPKFDAWYAPFENEMAKDELMRYFTRLRNEILKEGPTFLGVALKGPASIPPANEIMKKAPPMATGFFIGDKFAGAGWNISLPGGGQAVLYDPYLESFGRLEFLLPNPPKSHRGQLLDDDTSAQDVAELYFRYLVTLVAEAEGHFVNSTSSERAPGDPLG